MVARFFKNWFIAIKNEKLWRSLATFLLVATLYSFSQGGLSWDLESLFGGTIFIVSIWLIWKFIETFYMASVATLTNQAVQTLEATEKTVKTLTLINKIKLAILVLVSVILALLIGLGFIFAPGAIFYYLY